jgi:glycosyltransferase involved in cell wall biosynthesis
VEALGLIKDRLPFRLTMIGTGGTRAAIERRVAALGISDRTRIVPFMPQEDLWATLRQADLLCHPCDHEGVSKIIIESMMLGLPVLASDVPPLPDYVIEGETGYRVANTPDAWASKLLEIAGNKAGLVPLSQSARGFVETHYDMTRNIDLYETRFRALAEAR